MVSKQTVLELLPHYVFMLLLTFLAVGILRGVLGESTLVVEFVVVLVIVFLYPFGVRRLGYAPSAWE